ncbi:unnamed protein product, partial [Didymodactylos carnosus]
MNHLWFPHDVILDPYGNLYIADSSNRRIQRLGAKDGLMETIVEDGGNASEHLDSPFSLSDHFKNRIQKFLFDGELLKKPNIPLT